MSARTRTLVHVTLTTGHTRMSPRSEVSDEAIAALAPLLDGGVIPGVPGAYELERWPTEAGYLARVHAPDEGPALVTIGIARHAAEGAVVWDALTDPVKLALGRIQIAAPMPSTYPWCAVLVERGLACDPGAAEWLGDLERCVAWAWIESQR